MIKNSGSSTPKSAVQASPLPSATVVLLRDAAAGCEVLLLKRNTKIAYGGSWVFPGGKIDAGEVERHGGDLDAAALAAAVRETEEEAGLRLAPEALHFFSHWTTPAVRPKRFSTWFYLSNLSSQAIDVDPDAHEVTIDGEEIHQHAWHHPEEALSLHREGRIELPPPTFVTLTLLQPFASADEALMHFKQQTPEYFKPKVTAAKGGFCYLYHGDAGYESEDPDAAGERHRLWQNADDGWRYERD